MIGKRELQHLQAEWTLDIGVIEKDYVLGWLLAGVAQHPELARTWAFKGGTCLRKCYYETFRFSEDLDFTVVAGGPEEPGDLRRIFSEIAEWLREESGISLVVDETAFQRRRNRRGNLWVPRMSSSRTAWEDESLCPWDGYLRTKVSQQVIPKVGSVATRSAEVLVTV